MSHTLSVVPEPTANARSTSLCDRMHGLQVEARRLASEHVQELLAALVRAAQLSTEIATGGESYPPGIREEARRLEVEITVRANTVELLTRRIQD